LPSSPAILRSAARCATASTAASTCCDGFATAADIDPAYDLALRAALAAGVEALPYACRVAVDGITLERRLALRLP
jgi:DNA-binding sugar fermentation-stimulating protein